MTDSTPTSWRTRLARLFVRSRRKPRRPKSRWSGRATQVTRFAVVREAPRGGDPNILRSPTSKVGKSRYS